MVVLRDNFRSLYKSSVRCCSLTRTYQIYSIVGQNKKKYFFVFYRRRRYKFDSLKEAKTFAQKTFGGATDSNKKNN